MQTFKFYVSMRRASAGCTLLEKCIVGNSEKDLYRRSNLGFAFRSILIQFLEKKNWQPWCPAWKRNPISYNDAMQRIYYQRPCIFNSWHPGFQFFKTIAIVCVSPGCLPLVILLIFEKLIVDIVWINVIKHLHTYLWTHVFHLNVFTIVKFNQPLKS